MLRHGPRTPFALMPRTRNATVWPRATRALMDVVLVVPNFAHGPPSMLRWTL